MNWWRNRSDGWECVVKLVLGMSNSREQCIDLVVRKIVSDFIDVIVIS